MAAAAVAVHRAHHHSTPLQHDAKSMKSQLKAQTTKKEYDVTEFYHRTGFSQWIARHQRFERATLIVIALNALWIWIDTDLNPGEMLLESPPIFQIVEHVFCIYFTYEWTMRFLAFKNKRNCLRDRWFVFDTLLVATMVLETWIMSAVFLSLLYAGGGGAGGGFSNTSILRMARLLRLSRMARMARLLRALPELLILIKGMMAALRSVCFALGLLLVILYVFGIAFTQLCSDTLLEPRFETVIISMHTLLVYGALMDEVSSIIEDIEEVSIPILIFFYFFILLAALTVMNMLIGVICEMVLNVGEAEREASTVAFVKEKLSTLIKSCRVKDNKDDKNNNDDLEISKQDFIHMLKHEKAATAILHDVGVDLVGLVDIADTIFASDVDEDEDNNGKHHEKHLTFDEFVAVVLDLRGSKTARVKDVVNLRKHINGHFARLEQRLCLGVPMPKSQSQSSNEDETPINPARIQTVSFPECVSAAIQPEVGAAHEREVAFLQTDCFPKCVTTATQEPEVACLRAENLRLKEQLANLEERMSLGRSVEGVLAEGGLLAEGPFSSAKSDLVQRCLKDVVSRSASKAASKSARRSEPLHGAAPPDPIALDKCSLDFVRGADSCEQSLPKGVPRSARLCATGALANPVYACSTAQPSCSQNQRP